MQIQRLAMDKKFSVKLLAVKHRQSNFYQKPVRKQFKCNVVDVNGMASDNF